MLDILYTVIIYPIELIIGLFYAFSYRISYDYALSILGVSAAISILTLPLYLMTERLQRYEHDLQKRMKPETDNIKAVFSGDERFMRLATYYRQNGYHPLNSLRSSLSLIIQIPFFIAAYHFLSNLDVIKNIPFGPITDLSKPDALIKLNNISFNILPVIMTAINCSSAAIFSKGFYFKDKIQMYGLAAVFLVLLYNSPSGLLVYWTGNNLFSLVKNIIQKSKHSKIIVYAVVSLTCILLGIYILFIHNAALFRRVVVSIALFIIPLLPYLYKIFSKFIQTKFAGQKFIKPDNNIQIFLLALVVLFLLGGLVIPSSLISSSVQEFSFIDNYKTPFPFIVNTFFQALGTFFLWPLFIYLLFPQDKKRYLPVIAVIVTCISLINVFFFPGDYGYLTAILTITGNVKSGFIIIFFNLLALVIATVILLIIYKYKKIISSLLTIMVFACIVSGAVNCINIYKSFRLFNLQMQNETNPVSMEIESAYQFSKEGRNVVVIMLDRAISGFIPFIFEEKPELLDSFDGFTWYRNTVAFGKYTIFAAPAIFGGYEYTPAQMQARDKIPLVEKNNEGLLLMPRIFLDHDFEVFITNPPYANYSWISDLGIFSEYPQIHAENIIGKYTELWLMSRNAQFTLINLTERIESSLIRFSIFKEAPMLFRFFIYDNGKWLMRDDLIIPMITLDNYVVLDMLPEITKINDSNINTYNVLNNDLTHEPFFLKPPDYTPSDNISYKGDGPFSNESHYHVNIAAFKLLGKWFDFLKENHVYDNSRIIIVSDHGRNLYKNNPDNMTLPNGEPIDYYKAVLLVKDFNSHGNLSIDDSFMTNADVPLIAMKDIVNEPVNPWTGKLIKNEKSNGVTVTTSPLWKVQSHSGNIFNIKSDQWLHVKNDIYDPENWSKIKN